MSGSAVGLVRGCRHVSAVERQPHPHGRVAGDEEQPATAQVATPRSPTRLAGAQRDDPADRVARVGVRARAAGRRRAASPRVHAVAIGSSNAASAASPGSPSAGTSAAASALASAAARCRRRLRARPAARGRSRRARRRCASARAICQRGSGSPGYHLPWPCMEQRAGRERRGQLVGQPLGQAALRRAVGRDAPLRLVGALRRDEGRLAAHREPDVALAQRVVDRRAERLDARPGALVVGRGDARVLVEAPHRVGVGEVRVRPRLDGPGDRRGARGARGARQRDVALARQQPRRGVEADPARAGDVRLHPGVQVGEVPPAVGPSASASHELDEVAGGEARGDAQPAQDLHEQPRAVAAGADAAAAASRRVAGRRAPCAASTPRLPSTRRLRSTRKSMIPSRRRGTAATQASSSGPPSSGSR